MRRSNSVKQMLANKLSLKLCCLDVDKPCPWEIQNHQWDRSELVNKKHENCKIPCENPSLCIIDNTNSYMRSLSRQDEVLTALNDIKM